MVQAIIHIYNIIKWADGMSFFAVQFLLLHLLYSFGCITKKKIFCVYWCMYCVYVCIVTSCSKDSYAKFTLNKNQTWVSRDCLVYHRMFFASYKLIFLNLHERHNWGKFCTQTFWVIWVADANLPLHVFSLTLYVSQIKK